MPFYMDDLVNFTKLHSGIQDQSYSFLRNVQIKEYDPETNRVKVGFFDTETEEYSIISNWMPYFTPMNGLGKDAEAGGGKRNGHVFTPCMNEIGYMFSINGDVNNGIIFGGIYTDKRPPPDLDGVYTKAGEWFFFHNTGSYLKYTNDGDIFIKSDRNFRLIVDGQADVTILKDCNITVGGNVVINADKDVTATIGGNATLNVDGNMSADVGGNLDCSVLGIADIESDGRLFVQSNGDIAILSRGNLTLEGNTGVHLISPISITAAAPITLQADVETIVIPPLPPLVFKAPPKPLQAEDHSIIAAPGAPPAATGLPGQVTDTHVTNITPTSAEVDFNPPASGGPQ